MSSLPEVIDIHGHRMIVHADDTIVSAALVRDRVWEPLETHLVLGEVHNGNIVIDLGANIGYYTLLFAKLVGERGHVFSFEPDPLNFDLLQKNVALNGYRNISLIKKAVSNRSGPLKLYLAEENKGDHRVFDSGDGRKYVSIEAVRLDDYFKGWGRPIHFLKMDIQGAEGAAIEGATELLAKNPNLKIMSEFWPWGLKRSGSSAETLARLLQDRDYRLYNIDDSKETREVSTEELLGIYGKEVETFTTVFCIKTDWPGVKHFNTWGKQTSDAVAAITSIVPAGTTFILVDDNKLALDVNDLQGRRAIPFLEHDGQYWGRPANDRSAILELERLRESGAGILVFAWPAFWWLEHYVAFCRHLRTRYRCVLETRHVAIFHLESHAATQPEEAAPEDLIGEADFSELRANWRQSGDLRGFERRVSSQNGEDGILEEILRRIGVDTKFFVEFGASTGEECNCAHLVVDEKGWRGVFLEGDPVAARELASRYRSHPDVLCLETWVTSANIESILEANAVPARFDVLSIDIDGNDFWVWSAIRRWKPRIVVIEYNASQKPPRKWVMTENPQHRWDGTDYFGASLASLTALARGKGYELVGTDSMGVNAFFVLGELVAPDKFLDPVVHYHYSPPRYGRDGGGHPPGTGSFVEI